MGQGSSRLNWTCTCEDGKFNLSATYQEIAEDGQQQTQNKHQGVGRAAPSRTSGVRKETLLPIIDDEMQEVIGKGQGVNKKGLSAGLRRTLSSYELAQARSSNASAGRTPTTQIPKQYRSHEVLSSNSSASNTTESSGLSQSNSENSLHSSKSADSKLQRFIGLSNASKARQQQNDSSSRKSSLANGLPSDRKSSINSSTTSTTASITDRKSSVGDVGSLTELLKKKKKDARRAEIVANVTKRLYNTKKPEPKPEPVVEPPKPPQPEIDDAEPEELKLCMRARLQALSKRALNIHRGRRKGVDVEVQTDFKQQVLRVKEVAISTRDAFSDEFPLGYQMYDNQNKQLYLSNQAAWITFTRLFDTYHDFYSYPSMRGQNNIWGNFHGEPWMKCQTISSEDTFSDDSLEEVEVKQEEYSQPKVCGIISFASGDRFAPYEEARTCSTQTDCCNICNGIQAAFSVKTHHHHVCHCRKSSPEVQVTLFNGLPLTGTEETQISVDDGYSSSNKDDEELSINIRDASMPEIPIVDRMLYTITENSEQNSDCNDMVSLENLDTSSKLSTETSCNRMLMDKVVQSSPELCNFCCCMIQNSATLCSINLSDSCDKIVQVSGYCDICLYKEKRISSSQALATSDILPVPSCCLCMCPCDKKWVPSFCSCAVQCSLDKECLNKVTDKTTQTQKTCYCHRPSGLYCNACLHRQKETVLCEMCNRRIPPDKLTESKKRINTCCLCINQCIECVNEKRRFEHVLQIDASTNTSTDLQVLPTLQNQSQLLFGIPQLIKFSTLQFEDSIALFFASPVSQPTMVKMVTRETVGIQTDSVRIYCCTSPPPQMVTVVESTECYAPRTKQSSNEQQRNQPSTSSGHTSPLSKQIHSTDKNDTEKIYSENNFNNQCDNSSDDFSDDDDIPNLPRTTISPPDVSDSQNWSEMKNLILGRNKNLFPFYELNIKPDDNLVQRPQKKKSVSWSDLSGCGALHTEMVFDDCFFNSYQPTAHSADQRSFSEAVVPENIRAQPNGTVSALLMPATKKRQIRKLCDMPRRSWSMLDMKDLIRSQVKDELQLSAFLHEATAFIHNLSHAAISHNDENINSTNNNINSSCSSFVSNSRRNQANRSYLPLSEGNMEYFNKDSHHPLSCSVYQKYCNHKTGLWKTQHNVGDCNLNIEQNLDNRCNVSEKVNHYWQCHCQLFVPRILHNSPKAYMQHLVAIRRQIIQATSSSEKD